MLEAIARTSVDALCKVFCAYFGNIGRNSGYFLLSTNFYQFFWRSTLMYSVCIVHTQCIVCSRSMVSSIPLGSHVVHSMHLPPPLLVLVPESPLWKSWKGQIGRNSLIALCMHACMHAEPCLLSKFTFNQTGQV